MIGVKKISLSCLLLSLSSAYAADYTALRCVAPAQPALRATTSCVSDSTQQMQGLNDWQPQGGLGTCQGVYLLPNFENQTIIGEETRIDADEGEFVSSGVSTLAGNVQVEQRDKRMWSDRVYIHRDAQSEEVESVDAFGNVLLEEPMFRVLARSAHMDLLQKRAELQDGEYRSYENHARGHAQTVTYQKNQPTYLYNATYTTCEPDSNVWDLRAKEVSLNEETGQGRAYHAFLYLKDVPVLYTPWIAFPISDERQSGLLAPSYGASNRSGLSLSLPYYFNIAPNTDATFTPTVYEKRGILWDGEWRYLSAHTQGDVTASFINSDHVYQDFRTDGMSSHPNIINLDDPRLKGIEDSSDQRYRLALSNVTQFNSYWSGGFIYNTVSDDNYFEDFPRQGTQFDASLDTRQLLQQAQLNYIDPIWQVNFLAQEYQILQPFESDLYAEPYRILPKIQAMGDYADVWGGMDLYAYQEVARFEYNNDINLGGPFTTGDRAEISPILTLPQRLSAAYVTPRFEWRNMMYQLDRDPITHAAGYEDDITHSIPISSIDSGLFFERDVNWFNQDGIQTLEPRLYYLYVPYVNQHQIPTFDDGVLPLGYDQLFRSNRFIGRDRVGDANQMALGLTSRWLDGTTGAERLRMSVGQLYYFSDRNVTLCDPTLDPGCEILEDPDATDKVSNVVGQADYRINEQWSLNSDAQWDTGTSGFEDYSARVSYVNGPHYLLNLGYRYDNTPNYAPSKQTDTSFAWALNSRWKVLGVFQYDYLSHSALETLAGVEYENCCWAVRVGAARSKEISDVATSIDKVFYLQFVLKGFSDFGNGYGQSLAQTIPHYQDTLGKTF